ncbi:hypothetical protein PX52LOC_04448 [Limnoglobus roseus]|uniref:Uncharacterized protein n=1 Tax=Limnoglobus roseus TaxID=2598579 RepID=A0A5C1ADL6_9BACT|nr:hypothetical protein PX52LOC_04448 [Limnoglobus roseus]
MRQSLLPVLPLLAVSVFACVLALAWSVARIAIGGPASLGDPGAYIATALVGAGCIAVVRGQEGRIRDLEKRLDDLTKSDGPDNLI